MLDKMPSNSFINQNCLIKQIKKTSLCLVFKMLDKMPPNSFRKQNCLIKQ